MAAECFGRLAGDCLSNWQVSQQALGLTTSTRLQDHLEACPVCAARLHDERREMDAVQQARLPVALGGRPGRALTWRRWSLGAGLRRRGLWSLVAALLLGGGLLSGLARSSREQVLVDLRRGDQLRRRGVRPDAAGPLQAGDQLRLWVRRAAARWVRLEAQEGGSLRDVYYEGAVPPSGWLPAHVVVTEASGRALRLLACRSAPALGHAAQDADCFTARIE